MKRWQPIGWVCLGLFVGGVAVHFYMSQPRLVMAFNDRADECIMCTGPIMLDGKKNTIDGVWLLDYRAGKLLGTMVDRGRGKFLPWAEVDLIHEFNIAPKQNVHFMMTTGMQVNGQSALYLAETVTGRIAVYTMGPQADPRLGVVIRRHDAAKFR
jgi:hypothetical protein